MSSPCGFYPHEAPSLGVKPFNILGQGRRYRKRAWAKNPIFSATTNYGHFGNADLPWEKPDQKKLDKLRTP